MRVHVALLLLVAACARGDTTAESPRATRTDSAGITIAMNAGGDRPLPLRFTERLRLGGAESGPEAFYQVWTGLVGTDERGRLYVLDREAHRVVVFDSAGTFVREMARKGGGPGELQHPWRLVVWPDGSVAVADYGTSGLMSFAPDGTPRDAVAPWPRGASTPRGLGRAASGWVVERDDAWKPGDPVRTTLVEWRPDGATAAASTLLRRERKTPALLVFSNCPIRATLGPVFESTPVWDVRGARVALSEARRYVVDVFDGPRLVASWRRDIAPRPATRELALREVGKGLSIRAMDTKCSISADETLEKRGMAETLPAIAELRFAPDGTLWVSRGKVREEAPTVDVFSAEGDYLGTLPAGAPMPAAFLPNGDVVAVEQDEETDIRQVVVYRVERAPAPTR
ncbi:MAG TPA: 6-bladed beta-propeller [Gemmatimonadaceae bacterium]|nr:6-bladed beta-propeller [Gemmatimonadaceae bacterium]